MKKLLIILSLILMVGLWEAGSALAIGIEFQNVVSNDGSLSAQVVVTDLGKEIVSSYELAVGYDSSVLKANSVEFSGALGGDPEVWPIDSQTDTMMMGPEVLRELYINTAGSIVMKELSFLSDNELFERQGGGDVLLATLFFIKEDAFSILSPANTYSSDFGLEFVWGPSNEVTGRNEARIIPAPVPEPASLLLLGAGLAGLAGFGKKKLRSGR